MPNWYISETILPFCDFFLFNHILEILHIIIKQLLQFQVLIGVFFLNILCTKNIRIYWI